MNPPILSRLHDVKHKDRPLPRDPQAAGGSLLPQAPALNAGTEPPPDQRFGQWVDQTKATMPDANVPKPTPTPTPMASDPAPWLKAAGPRAAGSSATDPQAANSKVPNAKAVQPAQALPKAMMATTRLDEQAMPKEAMPQEVMPQAAFKQDKPIRVKDGDKPDEGDKAKPLPDAASPIPAAPALVLAPPQPPLPPAPARTPDDAAPPMDAAKPKAKPLQKAAAMANAATHEIRRAAEPPESKKPDRTAPAPTEKFGILLAETTAPRDMPAAMQPAPPAATLRAEPAAPAAPAQALQPPSLPVVAVPAAIAIKALEGTNHFDIRLEPEELGRIDVSLQIDRDGGIRAAIAAEKPEALQMIVREARALEQAIDQAGFRRDHDALSFSLSDQRQSSQGQQNPHAQRQPTTPTRFFVDGEPSLPSSLAGLIIAQSADGRLDVRI